MDWNDLANTTTLERHVARELARGSQPGRLRVRLATMGVDPEVARAVITRVRDEGADAVLRRHRGPRLKNRALAVALILLGLGLVVFSATFVDQDILRWWVFALSGSGLLAIAFGVSRVSR